MLCREILTTAICIIIASTSVSADLTGQRIKTSATRANFDQPLRENRDSTSFSDSSRGRGSLDDNGGTTFTSTVVDQIPDNGCASDNYASTDIVVSGIAQSIADIEVQIDNITHPYVGDLQIWLRSPVGTECHLAVYRGGGGDNFINTRFDDDASTPIGSGSAPFTGSFRPESALSRFDGENPNGTWSLRVCDNISLASGSLRGWRIQILGNSSARPCANCTPTDANLTIPTSVWGGSQSGNCGNAGKWVGQFSATGGQTYHFDLCPDAPGSGTANFDVDIKICNSSCSILGGVDGTGCSGGGGLTYRPNDYTWIASSSGTFFVIIAPYQSYDRHICTGTSSNTFTLQYYRETVSTYSIAGRLTWAIGDFPSAGPLSSYQVNLSGGSSQNTTTSSDGTYSFTGLSAGNYTIQPASTLTGVTWTPTSRNLNLPPSQTSQDFSVNCNGIPQATISCPASVNAGQQFQVTVTLRNNGTTTNAPTYLDCSIPENPAITGISGSGWASTPTLYPVGYSPIYTRSGSTMTALHPLISAVSQGINNGAGGQKTMTFSVTAPQTGSLHLRYRGTIGNHVDPPSGAIFDQQGWWVYEHTVTVLQSPQDIRFVGDLAFGDVVVGQSSQRNFDIYNDGGTALSITSVTSSNPAFAVNFGYSSVPAGGVRSGTVTFSPTDYTTYNGNLTIASNDPDESPLNIAMSGDGMESEVPNVQLVVPYYYQDGSYWCGPTTLAMLLGYYGLKHTPESIADYFDLSFQDGPSNDDVSMFLDHIGVSHDATGWYTRIAGLPIPFAVSSLKSFINSQLANSNPVWLSIAEVTSSFRHAMVVVGADQEHYYIHDPSDATLDEIGVTPIPRNILCNYALTNQEFDNLLSGSLSGLDIRIVSAKSVNGAFANTHAGSIYLSDYSPSMYFRKLDGSAMYMALGLATSNRYMGQAGGLELAWGADNDHPGYYLDPWGTGTQYDPYYELGLSATNLDSVQLNVGIANASSTNRTFRAEAKLIHNLSQQVEVSLSRNVIVAPYTSNAIVPMWGSQIPQVDHIGQPRWGMFRLLESSISDGVDNNGNGLIDEDIAPVPAALCGLSNTEHLLRLTLYDAATGVLQDSVDYHFGISYGNDLNAPQPVYNTVENQWFSLRPSFDIDFVDDYILRDVWYRIDNSGNWITVQSDMGGPAFTDNWTMTQAEWNSLSNGMHYLYLSAADCPGNEFETTTQAAAFAFGKDVFSPTSSLTSIAESDPNIYSPSPYSDLWYNSTSGTHLFVVSISASDATSGIERVEFPAAFGDPVLSISAPPFDRAYSIEQGASFEGPLNVIAYDRAGNTATVTVQVHRDITPPSVFYPALDGDPFEHYQNDETVTMRWTSPSDNSGGSGLLRTEVRRDAETWLTDGGTSHVFYNTIEGAHTFAIRAVDNVGNSAAPLQNNCVVDMSAPLVDLVMPVPGESWVIGETRTIQWIPATDIGLAHLYHNPIELRFSLNGGSSFDFLIASSLPNTGSYAWQVPEGLQSTAARIQVIAKDSCLNTGSDQSGNIIVSDPVRTVHVESPNGGEAYASGVQATITWTSLNLSEDVRIELNRSYPGPNWETITANTQNTGSFNWIVTPIGSTTARVRISGVVHTSVMDTSDGNFVILCTRPPAVNNVIATDDRCDSIVVTWTGLPDVTGYAVYLEGNLYATLLANETRIAMAPSAGTYPFDIRAVSVCGEGLIPASDFGARQPTPPQVQGVFASDDDSLQVLVTWTGIEGESGYYVYRDGQPVFTALADELMYHDLDGTYGTMYSYTVSAFNDYCEGALSIADVGARPFPIPVAPELVSPANMEVDVVTNPTTLQWLAVDYAVRYRVQVDVSNTFVIPILTDSTTEATYSAFNLDPLTTYYWRIQAVGLSGASDWTGAWSFTTSFPTINTELRAHWNFEQATNDTAYDVSIFDNHAVLYGGAHMDEDGQLHLASSNLSYARVNYSDTLLFGRSDFRIECVFTPLNATGTLLSRMYGDRGDIYLGIYNGFVQVQVDDSLSDGQAYWEGIGDDFLMSTGQEHRVVLERVDTHIRVLVNDSVEFDVQPNFLGSTNPPEPRDWYIGSNEGSSNFFTGSISDIQIWSAPMPAISIIRPNGGENLIYSTSERIRWNFADEVGTVSIKVNRDFPGPIWETLTSEQVSVSSREWTWSPVSGPTSEACRIAVVRDQYPTVADTSDASFSIIAASLSLQYPSGGEVLTVGDTADVLWLSENVTEAMVIELNRDYPQGIWETITPGVENNGTYPWIITSPSSTNARIRIHGSQHLDLGDTTASDLSLVIPTVTVLSPNGSEVWYVDSTETISWISSGFSGSKVVELNRNFPVGPWESVHIDTATIGAFDWTVSGPDATLVRVRVSSLEFPSASDVSDSDFAIVTYNALPVVVHDPLYDQEPESFLVTSRAFDSDGIANVRFVRWPVGGGSADSTEMSETSNPNEYSAIVSPRGEGFFAYEIRAYDLQGAMSEVSYEFGVFPSCSMVQQFDDGTAELSGWVSNPEFMWATKFEVVDTPYYVCEALVGISAINPDTVHSSIGIRIFLADGPDELPGTQVFERITGSIGNEIEGIPEDPASFARVVTRTGTGSYVVVDRDFYVAAYNPDAQDYEGFLVDTSATEIGRSFYYDGCDYSWHDESGPEPNAQHGTRMIRVSGFTLTPPLVVIQCSEIGIRLGWEPTGAPIYNVYAAEVADGEYDLIGQVSTSYFIDSDVVVYTQRFYYVRAESP